MGKGFALCLKDVDGPIALFQKGVRLRSMAEAAGEGDGRKIALPESWWSLEVLRAAAFQEQNISTGQRVTRGEEPNGKELDQNFYRIGGN